MGLDNRFVGRFKSHPELEISLAYFRKYFNLNDWMLQNCARLNPDEPYKVVVSKDNLEALLRKIEPIAEAIQGFTDSQISYYEDNGYPQEIIEKFYEWDFSPVSSNTFAAGHKLRKLYRSIRCMIEMLGDNDDGNFYITFYSSF